MRSKTNILLYVIVVLFFIFHSSSALGGTIENDDGLTEQSRIPENRVVYEVFVRNFSPEGNFKGVEAQISRLKELGVDVIWLMPIYKLGDIGKWGSYSSPYSIKDYTKIDPDNGTEQDLRDLIKTIHENGMEIWFDWVANHTSMDHTWVSLHPEFYSKADGKFVHPFNGIWKDVYKLDSDNGAMQDEMVRCMQYWVDNFDIDGFRCDYASGPSPELWRKATTRVLKKGKRIAWLAEDSTKPSLLTNGYFDYNYCWDFQEKILKKFVDNPDLATLRKACELLANRGLTDGEYQESLDSVSRSYRNGSRMVYLVNHDVVQDQGGTEDLIYGKYLKPFTVLQFTVYGMPLLYNGQEIQYKSEGRISLAEKTPIDWTSPDETMYDIIRKLCLAKHTQKALQTGNNAGFLTNLVTTADHSIYAYKRETEGNRIVVMLNFSDTEKNFSITGEIPYGKYHDILSGNDINISENTVLTLSPFGAMLLTLTYNPR